VKVLTAASESEIIDPFPRRDEGTAPLVSHLCLLLRKEQLEEPFGFSNAFLRQDDGFILVNRVRDETFLVKAVDGVKVKAFPRPAVFAQRQVKQTEDRIVDFLFVSPHHFAHGRKNVGF